MTAVIPNRIVVERDAVGLQQALRALFEEALLRHRMGSAMENADEYHLARLEAEIPEREISDGYFVRAGYLLGLSSTLELGIPMAPESITYADELGIRAVRAAWTEHEREHPACPRCSERQDNAFMKSCHACQYVMRSN